MKKIVLILFGACALSLSACVADQAGAASEGITAGTPVSSIENTVQRNEEKLVPESIEDTIGMMIDMGKSPRELLDELDLKGDLIENTNSQQKMLEKVVKYLMAKAGYYESTLTDLEAVGEGDLLFGVVGAASVEGLDPGPRKDILTEAVDDGMRVRYTAGLPDVRPDFERCLALVRGIGGPEEEFLEISAYFQAVDDSFSRHEPVNMDEYAAMMTRLEAYQRNWPDGSFAGEIQRLYRDKLQLYLLGNNDYPVFDLGTNKIRPDRLDIIKRHIEIHEGTAFSEILIKYVLAVSEHEYSYHPSYGELIAGFRRFGLGSDLELERRDVAGHGLSASLIVLKGHSDLAVQDHINNALEKALSDSMLQIGFDQSSEESFYFSTYVYLSNESRLTLECSGALNMSDWTLNRTTTSTLNFDMKTGRDLTIEDFFNQTADQLDEWLLPLANEELQHYFGDGARLDTLEGARYVATEDALLVIGNKDEQRAYIPGWKMAQNVDWRALVH